MTDMLQQARSSAGLGEGPEHRTALLILDMARRLFSDPRIKSIRAHDGAQSVTFHGYFCQVHFLNYPDGRMLLLNFPEPCRELDLSKLAAKPEHAISYGQSRLAYLLRELDTLMIKENLIGLNKNDNKASTPT